MATNEGKPDYPQDLVAIFHASFHPTKGNIVDWSQKASDDLNLDELQLEFSALPSGLHLVEQDVIYFTKANQHGLCVFRRRKTDEPGHRGFRLSSFGILLAKSRRPRPWRHVKDLKALIDTVYSRSQSRGSMEIIEEDWEPAREFFEQRKLRRADLGGAGDWTGWSDELDGPYSYPLDSNPNVHLPHLLRILGPSSLTLFKHVLGRKRILIYTLPPVEVSCILCQIAGDLCFEIQAGPQSEISMGRLKGKHKEPTSVLGMITLADLDRLEAESATGKGWIACTTDAIFMEKPSYYDLLIDLTTSTPNKATRPAFYASKPVLTNNPRPQYQLSTIRFAWSDVKLWTEVNRILQLDSDNAHHHHACCSSGPVDPSKPPRAFMMWTDAWQVYEDVCMICAGLWMGSWRGNSRASYSTANGAENWGSVRLEGDDDLSLGAVISSGGDTAGGSSAKKSLDSDVAYVRSLGMGIEGRPVDQLGAGGAAQKTTRRVSAMSWSSGKATVVGTFTNSGKDRQPDASTSTAGPSSAAENESYGLGHFQEEPDSLADAERFKETIMTTMAVLQTFHAHTSFQLSVLEDFLRRQGIQPSRLPPSPTPSNGSNAEDRLLSGGGEKVVTLTPKDILAFDLGPFSASDARYVEWLGAEYAGEGVRVVVRRGWRDLFNAVFGY